MLYLVEKDTQFTGWKAEPDKLRLETLPFQQRG